MKEIRFIFEQVEYRDVDDNFSDHDASDDDAEKTDKKDEKKERKPQVPIFPVAHTQAAAEGEEDGAESDNDDPTGKSINFHCFKRLLSRASTINT